MSDKFCIFFALIIISLRGYRSECTMSEEQLDSCMEDSMFFGSAKSIVPANDDDMAKHCAQVQKGISCMREYAATCLQGFAQQVTTMILTNMGMHMERRCNDAKEKADFIENAKCFLPKQKMKPLDICSEKNIKFLELSSTMGKDEHIPGTCCGYFLFKHCILTETENLCGKGNAQYWDEIFDEVASEAVAFACAEYDSKDQCEKLLTPEHWSEFKKVAEATDPALWAHHYKTPIKFIMDMIKKFHMNSRR